MARPDHDFGAVPNAARTPWRDRLPDWLMPARVRAARQAQREQQQREEAERWQATEERFVVIGKILERRVDDWLRQHPEWTSFRD
jgi:hypothetical protein